jgi:hypothetical protein
LLIPPRRSLPPLEFCELLAGASERILYAEHLEGEGAQIEERAGAMGVIVETPASPPNL